MLWLAVAAMTAVALALLLWPLLRRDGAAAPEATRAAHDIEIYRDQIAELDRERDSGLISAEQAAAARAEIGRRALRAADESKTPPAGAAPRHPVIAALVAVVVAGSALALYFVEGTPNLPGTPASETAGVRAMAKAEARNSERLIAELTRDMEQRPDDAGGWKLLGSLLGRQQRYDEAVRAYRSAVALKPRDADLLSRFGEAMTLAGQGTVTPRAAKRFAAALAIDPREPRARFYMGIADMQAGNLRQALSRWVTLERDSQPGAAWMATLGPRIDALARSLGLDPGTARGNPPKPGEDAAAQMAMIRAMVDRLAARLEKTPDDADGWLRLGRSWQVLGDPGKSREAYRHAARLRPKDATVLARYATSILRASEAGTAPPPEFGTAVAAALGIDPDQPDALWLAGLVAERRGDNETAATHWRRLLERLDPASPEHAQLKKRIDGLGAAQ